MDRLGPVPSATPRVSILTATYNRSNVLRLVIETVRRQTVTDWERVIQHGRKGGMLNHVRRRRGLPPVDWRGDPAVIDGVSFPASSASRPRGSCPAPRRLRAG